jgi:E3 SUMO-protein ligase PIAS1
MASMGGGAYHLPWEQVSRTLKSAGMVNRVLQQICVTEGLNKAGVKAELQQRIIDRKCWCWKVERMNI